MWFVHAIFIFVLFSITQDRAVMLFQRDVLYDEMHCRALALDRDSRAGVCGTHTMIADITACCAVPSDRPCIHENNEVYFQNI